MAIDNATLMPGVVLLVAVLSWFMPRLTRPDLYFAVTVAPGFRDRAEGKAILRRYRIALVLISALLLACAVILPGVPAIVFLQIASGLAIFFRARARVLPYAAAPTTIREAQIHFRKRGIPGGWPAATGPFVLLAACAVYLWQHWQEIPARFPTHWNFAGQPDNWTSRTLTGVYAPLAGAAAISAVMTIFLYGLAHWTRAVNQSGAAGAREGKFRLVTSLLILGMEYFGAIQISRASLAALRPDTSMPGGGIAPLILLVFVLSGLVAMVWLGQGGSRDSGENNDAPVGDRTGDDFWKLGVIYFNPDDPAILVEKRFGLGYTLNFARPLSWITMGLVALAVLVPLLLHVMKIIS